MDTRVRSPAVLGEGVVQQLVPLANRGGLQRVVRWLQRRCAPQLAAFCRFDWRSALHAVVSS